MLFSFAVTLKTDMKATLSPRRSEPAKGHDWRLWRPLHNREDCFFAEADTGAETLARAATMIETTEMTGHDPQVYPADILIRIHDHTINRLDELPPWNWVPHVAPTAEAA